eukprot:m.260945 g.260945  ORF g.260945 m.260945 type:complete len:263 (-) comp19683_c0_seq1:272-1060(-)
MASVKEPGFRQAAAAMGIRADDPMLTQASQLWEMMDEMAVANPEGYQRFIAKQMKEKADYDKKNAPPTPIFGVRCNDLNKTSEHDNIVWVNFSKSDRVQAPKSEDDAIPIVVLEPSEQKHNGSSVLLYEAAMHPSIFDRIDNSEIFKKDLIQVGLDCIEQRATKLKKPVKLDRFSVRVREKPFHKPTLVEKIKQAQTASSAPFEMHVPGETAVPAACGVADKVHNGVGCLSRLKTALSLKPCPCSTIYSNQNAHYRITLRQK